MRTSNDVELAALYRALLLPRLVEEKMLRLLRQGRLSKWFSGIGQEAIAVGVVAALSEHDFVLPLHRNLGIFTTRGVDLDRLLRQLLGREGDFREALNLASVWRLPVVFVVENNGWGLSTPTSEQYACRDLADRGPGYGMPGAVVDGNDVLAVVAAVGEAAERARLGEGPT